MARSFGSRTLLAICGALAVLLAVLATVQYQWSTRVAAADAQREKEHLDSAASLFANEFNAEVGQAADWMQNEVRGAQQSGQRLASRPKLIGELYYFETPVDGTPQAQRLTADGAFIPAPTPDWFTSRRCAATAIEQPPALVSPVYELPHVESQAGNGIRILTQINRQPQRCFVGRLDEGYLQHTFFPQLIKQSFGATAANDYDFAVVSHRQPAKALYGSPSRADVRKPFFSVPPNRLAYFKSGLRAPPASGQAAVFIQRMETVITKTVPAPTDLFGPGIWDLQVAHKGVPLAAAFEQARQRNVLMSIGVEALLIAAIVFLVIASRRMQRLADQKMQFVAGVSHELRTPVSAIAMLSRNQADGLVTGADRVKQYGELIHQQTRRLNEMVEQTLQYAGIHSGLRRPARNEVDLGRLIQETVDARREELSRAGFEVELISSPDLPKVAGDTELLRTAFDNLLNNAQKYAGAGHWIRIRTSYSERDKEVLVSVEDRGPGIDAADQAEIFEPFCRGRAAIEAQIPGSGLGLSLVRSAAEAHRGTVTLASEPGRGCTFTMHLPV